MNTKINYSILNHLSKRLTFIISNVGDLGSIPGLGRSPGEGKGYPLQYSGLENSLDYSPWGHTDMDTTEQRSFTFTMYYAAAKSLQSCLTLFDPIPGILQARTLEWVAISFSNTWKGKVKVKSLSHVWLFETPWTAAYQAPLSMGFSRQEYWSGVLSPSLTTYYNIY